MATYTANYQLHQWVPEDQFRRTDFNQDFQKIDTALAGLKTLADGKAGTAALEAVRPLAGGRGRPGLGGGPRGGRGGATPGPAPTAAGWGGTRGPAASSAVRPRRFRVSPSATMWTTSWT